jgi:hypothetical protein
MPTLSKFNGVFPEHYRTANYFYVVDISTRRERSHQYDIAFHVCRSCDGRIEKLRVVCPGS